MIRTLLGALAVTFLLAAALAACSPLAAFNALAPDDRGARLAQADIAYSDGPRQKLDVYIPETAGAPTPVVVIFYGGAWNSGRKSDYAFLGKAVASKGFVAIVADYRLVPEIRFPSFIEDAALAVKWAAGHATAYNGDPSRIFLMGHSAGAYIAAMVALDDRYLLAAGAKPSVVRGVIGLAGPYDFLPLDVASTKAAFGKEKDLARTQPINFVTAHSPPMFLATGSGDTTVRPRNSKSLSERLKQAGVPVTLKIYPGLSHVDILLATSVSFRAKAPVLEDLAEFVRQTPASNSSK